MGVGSLALRSEVSHERECAEQSRRVWRSCNDPLSVHPHQMEQSRLSVCNVQLDTSLGGGGGEGRGDTYHVDRGQGKRSAASQSSPLVKLTS